MNEPLHSLHARFTLPEEKKQSIQQQINSVYTRTIQPQAHPKVIVLGAQPGAGKSELEAIALRELHYDAVVNNADNYRDYHPQAHLIKKEYEQHYPELTAPYAQEWALGLQQYCLHNKLNYTLETTLRDGKRLNDTIAFIKEHGYSVEVKVLAVHRSISLLSAFGRFERAKMTKGSGRAVSSEAHDSRYNAIPGALKEIEEAKLYDSISIYGRRILDEGTTGERSGVVHVATDPFSPVQTYLQERNRVLSEVEKKVYNGVYEGIINLMKGRHASVEEITFFESALQMFSLRHPEQDKRWGRKR